ncbi:MAG: fimbria/pilus periplasmic chaperone [Rhodobacter sp.]|nr:fimbria/pilus periplasmic chaperone [Rhodobacter sp.]
MRARFLIGKRRLFAAAAAALLCLSATAAAAESISVSPTRLSVPAGGQQSVLTVKAAGAQQSVVQVRVMKWNENRPASELRQTRDVVVSPPISRLSPRQELTVRIVRTSRKAVRGRECYRVLVDRLPSGPETRQAVALRIRHSVPLCFTG